MTRFIELAQVPPPSISGGVALGVRQKERDAQFPAIVAESPFRLWHPGDRIKPTGDRVLIGVATWSPPDLAMLDILASLASAREANLDIDVFNVSSCPTTAAFEEYVPGIGAVFHTPVVGVWIDGVLTDKSSGKRARDLIARACRLSAIEFERAITEGLRRE